MLLLPPSLSLPDNHPVPPVSRLVLFLLQARELLPRLSVRLGWTLYTIFCLCFFLFPTFPTEVLLQRVLRGATSNTLVYIQYGHGALTWWGGCRLSDVVVESSSGPAVRIAHVTLQPSLLGLIVGRPWPLTFTAHLYGGTLSGTVSLDTDGQKVQFTAHRLDLSLLPLPETVAAGEVQGSLSGEGTIEGNGMNLFSLHGQVTVTLTEGALREGKVANFPIPPLSLVEGRLRAMVKNGLLEIPDFRLHADNTEAHLQGTITLNTPLPQSGLNLQLAVKTTGNTSSPLTILLSMLPASPNAPGERQASISGSFVSPLLR